jgi:DNA-binding response OmpR family regulator
MRNVLIVDDDDELSGTLQEILEMENCAVTRVTTCADATRVLGERQFALVLLDWQLDDMPGIELLKSYRQSGGKVRVLMMTGMRDTQSREAGAAAGADDFISKPFSVDQFLERLRSNLP